MIVLNLDKVMKERKVKLKDLAAIRFSTLNALCKELECQPADILEYKED